MLEEGSKLHVVLKERLGAEVARLFAEPVITWGNGAVPGSVSWYADADGEVQRLGSLPTERRKRLELTLHSALALLLPLRTDSQIGPLVSGALILADQEGILAVGDRVVLVTWGLTGTSDTPAALEAQFEATFGPYLTQPAVKTVDAAPSLRSPDAMPPRPSGAPAASPPAAPMPVNRTVALIRDRWLLLGALATALVFLILGLLLGAKSIERQWAAQPDMVHIGDPAAIRDATARRQAENAALQSQIDAARRTLNSNVCVADPIQLPSTVPPETPITPAMRPPAPAGGTPFQGTLVELLRQATVLVLVPNANNLALGTGFFIGPKLAITNRHVVESAGSDGIIVVNAKLGRPMRATLLAQTPNSEIYQPDVAVLEVGDAPAIQPLSFTRITDQLDAVVAAGFPGVLLRADDNFSRLLHGDLAAMPSVILTDGRINAVQTAPTGMPILPHSAQIAPGNSGGPLVDACGRVVGINTFINVSSEQAVHINYAEKSDAVLDFLHSKQVPGTDSPGPCVPGVRPPVAAAPPTVADAPAVPPRDAATTPAR